MLKAIVFDLGNVVFTNDHPYHTPEEVKEFCDYFGVTMDRLDLAFWSTFPDYTLGKYSEEKFWEKFLHIARVENPDINQAENFWRKNQKENENMLSLLRRLKRKYRLGVLSTIPREWLEFKRKKFNLDSYFDTIISSGEYGIEKPNPEIYKIVIEKMKLKPREMLFIDDKESNLAPAQKLGMAVVLFRGQKDLEAKLKEMLK